MSDQLAASVVVGAVAVQRGAAGESIDQWVGRDPMTGEEQVIIAQRGLAFAVPRQGVETVAVQPHDGPQLAHRTVMRVGVENR